MLKINKLVTIMVVIVIIIIIIIIIIINPHELEIPFGNWRETLRPLTVQLKCN